jgi:hypothetical protein
MTTAKTATYWTSTALLAFVLFTGGIADLTQAPGTAQGVLDLGYPPMFLTILGTWKVLGAAALLAPRLPRLKEWAYAGAFFNFTGALLSHLVAGSATFHIGVTAALTALTMVSWAYRPSNRTLGTPTWQPAGTPTT